jgi:hypothetical protein
MAESGTTGLTALQVTVAPASSVDGMYDSVEMVTLPSGEDFTLMPSRI